LGNNSVHKLRHTQECIPRYAQSAQACTTSSRDRLPYEFPVRSQKNYSAWIPRLAHVNIDPRNLYPITVLVFGKGIFDIGCGSSCKGIPILFGDSRLIAFKDKLTPGPNSSKSRHLAGFLIVCSRHAESR